MSSLVRHRNFLQIVSDCTILPRLITQSNELLHLSIPTSQTSGVCWLHLAMTYDVAHDVSMLFDFTLRRLHTLHSGNCQRWPAQTNGLRLVTTVKVLLGLNVYSVLEVINMYQYHLTTQPLSTCGVCTTYVIILLGEM